MRALPVVACCIGTWLFTSSGVARAEPRRVVDRVVAIVDRGCITQSELDRAAAPAIHAAARATEGKPDERVTTLERVRREALHEHISRVLLLAEAVRQAIQVTDEEVERALAAIAAQNRMRVAELFVAAAAQGLDEAAYRTELQAQMFEAKLLQREAQRRAPEPGPTDPAAMAERLARVRMQLLETLRERAYIEVRL